MLRAERKRPERESPLSLADMLRVNLKDVSASFQHLNLEREGDELAVRLHADVFGVLCALVILSTEGVTVRKAVFASLLAAMAWLYRDRRRGW